MAEDENVIYDEVRPSEQFELDDDYEVMRMKPIRQSCEVFEQIPMKKSKRYRVWLVLCGAVIFTSVAILLLCFVTIIGMELFKVKGLLNQQIAASRQPPFVRRLEDAVDELNFSIEMTTQHTDSKLKLIDGKIQELNISLYQIIQEHHSTNLTPSFELTERKKQALNTSWQTELSLLYESIEVMEHEFDNSLQIYHSMLQQFAVTIHEMNISQAKIRELILSEQNLSSALQQVIADNTNRVQQLKRFAYQELNASISSLHASIENAVGQYTYYHTITSCEFLPPFSPPGYYWANDINSTRATRVYCDTTGKYSTFPASACADLPPSFPSGYYWVRASNGSAVRVYCDMTRSCGGITGGWMRVAELDMTNSSHQCPSGLTEHVYSNSIKRTCVRNTHQEGCSSVAFFIKNANNYTHVCGKVIGYQYGTPEAFRPHYQSESVDMDGVILSHGHTQLHIWSFAAARGETFQTRSHLCPCIRSTANFSGIPTSNVGDDYFCDTGSSGVGEPNTFYGDDPLWDGAGCENTNTCCTFNTPPWFYKQLPQPTTDYIEMRVCRSAGRDDEDIAIEMYEIFIQ